jgi:hypothetical protein
LTRFVSGFQVRRRKAALPTCGGFPPLVSYLNKECLRVTRSRLTVSTTLPLLLAFTAAITASPHALPFTVALIGNANPMPTCDPCVLDNTEAGTGHAAHGQHRVDVTQDSQQTCISTRTLSRRSGSTR